MSDYRDSATRFFWWWLISGTAASILGNVTHALLSASDSGASPVIAASMSLAPPVVLLLATHGVHALVRSRIVGRSYWAALAITVALACCAFVLSFEALRDLAATYAGMRSAVAWLWPLAIDLSITGSTVALLALSSAHRVEQLDEVAAPEAEEHHDHVHVPAPIHLDSVLHADKVYGVIDDVDEAAAISATLELSEPVRLDDTVADVEVHHVEAAARIVEAGITRVDALRVARVLAEYTAGTAPSTIARKLRMGYETVACILDFYTEQIEVKA
ncbi:DUF2637 domain-containing protein [Mycobacteroides abscessus]|nr:DUF2637 domain-containing protein [Mycobacteroides abscessus]MDM2133634.1 DUF2637 domain-containing protein [Mycobacteroides abscessus]MDM2142634.1 DUF2637 domain-containing protein [Mycobacteroides abscessus]MDM2153760.1 DUF2637 domain-containing protein [Mycobacteroides abscessus]MDM2182793.1 DUF2637 domain-containing protein [Mycobacteroides abscessus]